MDDWSIVTVCLVCLTLVGCVWLLFSRPTGPRIVRFARGYVADHPDASSGDVRDALRTRFLGGVGPIDWSPGRGGQAEGEALGRVAEGVRDYWFPLDRDAIARKIEAAVAITGATDRGPPATPGIPGPG